MSCPLISPDTMCMHMPPHKCSHTDIQNESPAPFLLTIPHPDFISSIIVLLFKGLLSVISVPQTLLNVDLSPGAW